ncbi:general substrate transporter, partial [Limtongia smithiae]|uniref:general substrate transporter n=1 Tax=Limtongia smithiae TaxID=1125753 RepID=UPI0034CED6DB
MASSRKQGSILPSVVIGSFAAIGGILYGYDTGLIAGILAMPEFKKDFGSLNPLGEPGEYYLPPSRKSFIVSTLSAGLFCGAFSTGYLADFRGRRPGLIFACFLFMFGVAMQVATLNVDIFVIGRFLTGCGVGSIAAIGPLYQAEIAPKHLRGTLTAFYHTAKTFGVLIASVVDNESKNREGRSSYLVPIYLQFLWAIILVLGFAVLPESPRYFMKIGRRDAARKALARIRSYDEDHEAVTAELDEIQATIELEQSIGDVSIADCFKRTTNKQSYRMTIGLVIGAMSQLVGVNFIKYFGTDFFMQAGVTNSFVVSMATNMVSFTMTLPSLYLIERLGRRPFLTIGLLGCFATQYIIAITGLILDKDSDLAKSALVLFTILYIAVESCGAGPPMLVVIGETFPLRTRAKSIAMSIGCDYVFNFLISITSPYLVDPGPGSLNLGTSVFFIWGTSSFCGAMFVYFFVYETRGLTLEEIDEMYTTVPAAWHSNEF